MIPSDRLKVEIVGEPSQHHQNRSRYGCSPEEDELRIVLCDLADPTVREGWLVAVDLGYPIDDEESWNDCIGAQLEEERGFEFAQND